MKRLFFYIALVLILTSVISCHKESILDANNPLSRSFRKSKEITIYGRIQLGVAARNYMAFPLNCAANAQFFDSTNHSNICKITQQTYNVGTIYIDNLLLKPDSNDLQYHSVIDDPCGHLDPTTGSNFFGKEVIFKIAGNGITLDSITDTMYVPKLISMTRPTKHDTLFKNRGLTIQWLPDSKNDIGVFIHILYLHNLNGNNTRNLNLPNTDKFMLKQVPDNGSYTLSTNDLAEFPKGSIVEFRLGRGNQIFPSDARGRTIQIDAINHVLHYLRVLD